MIKALLASVALLEAIEQGLEHSERRQSFDAARSYADSVAKPLLVVGTPKLGWFHHPCGDTTIDIDPSRAQWCETEIADVRAIPYPDDYFGAAYCSHVLEHLPTINDCYQAIAELHRVAEQVFICLPRKNSITAWLHPQHHLWVSYTDKDGYVIEQR